MDVIAIFRAVMSRSLLGLIVILSLLATPAFPLEYQDSQLFITGFNAYQEKDYQGAIDKMSLVLKKFPDTPLRDMALFWLARAHFKAGHRPEAARAMAQFFREYPDSPLKGTVEPELAKLAAAFEKGEPSLTAAEKAAAEKQATEKAAADRAIEEKAAAAKSTADKAAAEKLATEKAAADKVVAEKAAADKTAAEKAATDKAATERLAVEKAWAERVASDKAAAEKKAAEKVALEKKAAAARKADSATAMKEKAIAGYKAVIDRYPGSRAAATASANLKELGIVYPAPVGGAAAAPGENARIMTLEVGQFADFSFTLAPVAQSYPVGKRFSIPFEVANRGNGPDSFFLESGFPSEFDVRFAATAAPDISISVTPQLAPGEKFTGVVTAVIPRVSIDGQKSVYPIQVASQFSRDASQSREIPLVAAAPLLRGVVKPDRGTVLPGEKVAYRIALLNAGSAAASGVTLRLNYPPQYEPVDFLTAGFRQEMKGALVLEGLRINSGESREFTVAFQAKEDVQARQELFLRGDVINSELESRDSFLSAAVTVQVVSAVTVRTNTEKLVVIPGQTVTIPVVVTNTGNMREAFQIRPDVPAGLTCRFFPDPKRDGTRPADAPAMTTIGPLAPREEAYLLMELTTPPSAADGNEAVVNAFFATGDDKGKNATVTVRLKFARPIVELDMTGKGGKLRPGDVSSYELNVVNRGSNLARAVELQSTLPGNLEIVAADPPSQQGSNGEYLWKFAELGAGEKRSVRITFRVKAGIPVGTNIQIRNIVTYEDQLGNRH